MCGGPKTLQTTRARMCDVVHRICEVSHTVVWCWVVSAFGHSGGGGGVGLTTLVC